MEGWRMEGEREYQACWKACPSWAATIRLVRCGFTCRYMKGGRNGGKRGGIDEGTSLSFPSSLLSPIFSFSLLISPCVLSLLPPKLPPPPPPPLTHTQHPQDTLSLRPGVPTTYYRYAFRYNDCVVTARKLSTMCCPAHGPIPLRYMAPDTVGSVVHCSLGHVWAMSVIISVCVC